MKKHSFYFSSSKLHFVHNQGPYHKEFFKSNLIEELYLWLKQISSKKKKKHIKIQTNT